MTRGLPGVVLERESRSSSTVERSASVGGSEQPRQWSSAAPASRKTGGKTTRQPSAIDQRRDPYIVSRGSHNDATPSLLTSRPLYVYHLLATPPSHRHESHEVRRHLGPRPRPHRGRRRGSSATPWARPGRGGGVCAGRGHRPADRDRARRASAATAPYDAGLCGARRSATSRWSTASRTAGDRDAVACAHEECFSGEIRLLVSGVSLAARVQPANDRQDPLLRRAPVVAPDGGDAAPARRRRRSLRRPPPDRHRSLVRQRGGPVRGAATRASASTSRSAGSSGRHRLHRLDPRRRDHDARARRLGLHGVASRRRPPTPSGSRSGPTSTACCPPIRAGSKPRSRCRAFPTTSCSSSRTSAPRWSIRRRCIRRARRRSRSDQEHAQPVVPGHRGAGRGRGPPTRRSAASRRSRRWRCCASRATA